MTNSTTTPTPAGATHPATKKMMVTLPEALGAPRVAAVKYNADETACAVLGAGISIGRADALAQFLDGVIAEAQAATLRGVVMGKMQQPDGCWQTIGAGGGAEEAASLAKMLNGNYRQGDPRLAPIVAAALRGLYGEALLEQRTSRKADFSATLRRLADAIDDGVPLATTPLTSAKIPAHH